MTFWGCLVGRAIEGRDRDVIIIYSDQAQERKNAIDIQRSSTGNPEVIDLYGNPAQGFAKLSICTMPLVPLRGWTRHLDVVEIGNNYGT